MVLSSSQWWSVLSEHKRFIKQQKVSTFSSQDMKVFESLDG